MVIIIRYGNLLMIFSDALMDFVLVVLVSVIIVMIVAITQMRLAVRTELAVLTISRVKTANVFHRVTGVTILGIVKMVQTKNIACPQDQKPTAVQSSSRVTTAVVLMQLR